MAARSLSEMPITFARSFETMRNSSPNVEAIKRRGLAPASFGSPPSDLVVVSVTLVTRLPVLRSESFRCSCSLLRRRESFERVVPVLHARRAGREVAIDGALPVAVHRIGQDDVARAELISVLFDGGDPSGHGLLLEDLREVVQVVAH